MRRKFLSIASFLVVIAVTVGVVTQRQLLYDTYVAKTSALQSEAAAIKESLLLTKKGDFLYRASRPQVQSADQFNESCRDVRHEHSIVLGCYARQRVFIYDVEDERLSGVKEVTAAHELLHAVYERLSSSEKSDLNQLLVETARTINNQRFNDTIEEYRRTDPAHLENELHSILGTEIAVLPTRLEQHYAKYFTNRARVVAYAKQYEGAFAAFDSEIKQYDQQLSDLIEQKESLESSLGSQQQNIELERNRLNALRDSGDLEAYNAAVPAYNLQIQSYNQTVADLRQIIKDYNQTVEKRNALAASQSDLVKQLDSSYDPLEQ